MFFIFIVFGLVAQWKRVCLLSRRLWVRPPPGSFSMLMLFILSFFLSVLFYFLSFWYLFFFMFLLFIFFFITFFSVLPYFSFLFLCCESKSGRVVQGGSLRYCSLRRRGFEPHLLHFSFFYSPFPYILLSGYFLFLIYGWPLSIVGSAFP